MPDRYDAAIANMRDTAKWFIGSIGAVFVVLLAGIQFGDVPFLSNPWAAGAGIVAVGGVMLAFGLAIGVLTGGSMSFHELKTEARLRPQRDFIDAVRDKPGWFATFSAGLKAADEQVEQGKLSATDADYVAKGKHAEKLLSAAKWHVIKSRFGRLVIVMMMLIPVELGAAAIIFALPDAPSSGPVLKIEWRGG